MSHRASLWAWEQTLRPNLKLVLLALADTADADDASFASVGFTAERCGLDRSTVARALRDLMGARILARTQRTRQNGARTSSLYTFQIPASWKPKKLDKSLALQQGHRRGLVPIAPTLGEEVGANDTYLPEQVGANSTGAQCAAAHQGPVRSCAPGVNTEPSSEPSEERGSAPPGSSPAEKSPTPQQQICGGWREACRTVGWTYSITAADGKAAREYVTLPDAFPPAEIVRRMPHALLDPYYGVDRRGTLATFLAQINRYDSPPARRDASRRTAAAQRGPSPDDLEERMRRERARATPRSGLGPRPLGEAVAALDAVHPQFQGLLNRTCPPETTDASTAAPPSAAASPGGSTS